MGTRQMGILMTGWAMALALTGCPGGASEDASTDAGAEEVSERSDATDDTSSDTDDATASDTDASPQETGIIDDEQQECDWPQLHTIGPSLVQTPVATLEFGARRLLALADIDGDGLDEFVTGYRREGWWVNDGHGQRLQAGFTGEQVQQARACDLDADGRDDLILTVPDTIVILHSLGDGRFDETRFTIRRGDGVVVDCGDVDRDGRIDVVYGTESTLDDPDSNGRGHVGVLLGRPGFTFAPGPLSGEPDERAHPRHVVALHLTDADGDGILDVVTAGPRGDVPPAWDAVVVQKGLGDGRFAWHHLTLIEGLTESLWAELAEDPTADGQPDLLACTSTACGMARRLDDARFDTLLWLPNIDAHGPSPSLVAADVDADGVMDLAGPDARGLKVGLWRGTVEGFEAPLLLLDAWGRDTTVLADRPRQRLYVTNTLSRFCEAECTDDSLCPAEGVCTLSFCSECYEDGDCGEGHCRLRRCTP